MNVGLKLYGGVIDMYLHNDAGHTAHIQFDSLRQVIQISHENQFERPINSSYHYLRRGLYRDVRDYVVNRYFPIGV